MPELPEVETIVRGLSKRLPGLRVQRVLFRRKDIFRAGSLKSARLNGSRIVSVERVGKNTVIRFNPNCAMIVNLGMTGRLILTRQENSSLEFPGKHLHGRIFLSDGSELRYYDARRFGYILITERKEVGQLLHLGKDPFQMRPKEFQRILVGRTAPVKAILLNQQLISGMGNIYCDESLFRAGIHPSVPARVAAPFARKILHSARIVLRRAIRYRGTTMRDYRAHDGSKGSFQQKLSVYGRTGMPCVKCGSPIEKMVVAGRGTHFCPHCQPRHVP